MSRSNATWYKSGADMSHTPGPWEVRPYDYGKSHYKRAVFKHGRKIPLVVIHGDPNSQRTNDANAHLIAAAPEMLEALKEVRCSIVWDDMRISRGTLNKINKAIAKAKGEK